ncbi:MAG: MarR family winged helix-turn-helix transcriptional regulator [Nocardioidaceae bacterium]
MQVIERTGEPAGAEGRHDVGSPSEPQPRAHENAVLALLPALMDLKSLLRQVSHWQLSEQASTSLAVLALLERCGPARVSDLADVAQLDTSVVSRQAKALEAAGLIQRSTDPHDGRVRRLQLSAAGVQALTTGRAQMAELITDRLTEWSPEELHVLVAGLRHFLRDLTVEAASRPFPPLIETSTESLI